MSLGYNKASMQTLYQNLEGYYKDLNTQAGDIQTAAGQIRSAWDTGAVTEFNRVQTKWDTEFEDTTILLNNIAAAVESAMNRAFGTDGKIGDGFNFA